MWDFVLAVFFNFFFFFFHLCKLQKLKVSSFFFFQESVQNNWCSRSNVWA